VEHQPEKDHPTGKIEPPKEPDQESEENVCHQSESTSLSTSDAIRAVRTAYTAAKRAYRVHPDRLSRLSDTLALYVGTRNFYNYTIQKTFRDPSAKRVIKSFKISRPPLIINGTEWLSLKVHGQSFMMHQIRKMVAMAVLLVRCGCDIQRVTESYGDQKIPVPKAPGLGLLLERPIFDTYNKKAVADFGKNPIDFSKYEKEIEEFKQREIYERIFREEEETNAYVTF
jgi:tRNA pseudouridine38-40 synthase